jgi:hypothetical protein
MVGKQERSDLNQRAAEVVRKKAAQIRSSPWFDCARDIQIASREIAERFGLENASAIVPALAEITGAGVNTIRRYMALLEFVDRVVLPHSSRPHDEALAFVRANFSGLEKISRIEKMDPTEADKLLDKLQNGEITTRGLETELEAQRKKHPSSATSRRGQAISSRMRELRDLEENLGKFVLASFAAGTFARVNGPSFVRAHWVFTYPEGSQLIGYLPSAATSDGGFEDALIQAAFSSRFFRTFFLVMPFVAPSFFASLDTFNSASNCRVGILQYSGQKIDLRREAGEPEYRLLPVEIDSQTLMIKS